MRREEERLLQLEHEAKLTAAHADRPTEVPPPCLPRGSRAQSPQDQAQRREAIKASITLEFTEEKQKLLEEVVCGALP